MQNGDRNAFASSAVPSLAEVAARIAAIDQISAARKAAIRSALNTASRWFKLPATAIPAHPEFLRRLFAGFSPAAVGATQKRVSNVKSDLLFAMRRLGLLAPRELPCALRAGVAGALAQIARPVRPDHAVALRCPACWLQSRHQLEIDRATTILSLLALDDKLLEATADGTPSR